MFKPAFLAVAALLLTASPAHAWWDYGHETVAEIAYRNVTPKTRAAMDALLRHGARLGTPECPVSNVRQASTWPDCIKALGQKFRHTGPWHYQNVEVCQPFDLTAACADGNCVSAQITQQEKRLADRRTPMAERVAALAYLIHFVGDLHMPLHAGDRADRGGNDVKTAYGDAYTRRMNLHSVWDGYLAERAISTPPALVRRYTPAQLKALAAGSVEDWSRENWAVSRDAAYATALGGDACAPKPEGPVTLSNPTIETLVPPIRQQIERGGARLARLLNKALG